MRQWLLPLLCWLLPFCHGGYVRSAHVQGRLLCHGQPYAGEKVEIWANVFGPFDTLLDSMITTPDGYFNLNGSYVETFNTSPTIYVYFVNYCEPAIEKESFVCGNTIKAFIPSEFITRGRIPTEVGTSGQTDRQTKFQTFFLDELEVTRVINSQFGIEKILYRWFDHKECRDGYTS